MKIAVVGLHLSTYVLYKGEVCCVCMEPIRPSAIRPYSTVLCITRKRTDIYCLCYKCAIVSWVATYTTSLNSISRTIDMLGHTELVKLLDKSVEGICSYFENANILSKTMYDDILFGSVPTCYYCKKEVGKKGRLCKKCKRTTYCSTTCLNKDKYKHRKLMCNLPLFITDKIYQ